jgi:hypothetical protein
MANKSSVGINVGGLGAGAGEDLIGINVGGLGVGAGESVKGFSVGLLGAGAGEDMAGFAFGGRLLIACVGSSLGGSLLVESSIAVAFAGGKTARMGASEMPQSRRCCWLPGQSSP